MTKGKGSLASWALGLTVLVGPYLILEFIAPSDVSIWARIYIAGALGGLCFELIRNRWRLEVPSDKRGVGKLPEPTFAPFGPLLDIGFLGRMTTGAVAAPAFVALVDALDATEAQSQDLSGYLTSIAGRSDTLAWGVAVGFAAPAVWSLMETIVKTRSAVTQSRLETAGASVEVAKEKVLKQLQEVKQQRQAATQEASDSEFVVPDGDRFIQAFRERGMHVAADSLSGHVYRGGELRIPRPNGGDAEAMARQEQSLSEALGALDAAGAATGARSDDTT